MSVDRGVHAVKVCCQELGSKVKCNARARNSPIRSADNSAAQRRGGGTEIDLALVPTGHLILARWFFRLAGR